MKNKMHLGVRVPSEGARLLARWIAEQCRGDLTLAAIRLATAPTYIQRLLAGEIAPGEDLAERIGRGTVYRIARRDWLLPAACGWFEQPGEAEPMRRAA